MSREQRIQVILTLVAGWMLLAQHSMAWGAWGHKRITRSAVYALPDALRPLFKRHLPYLETQSLVPDRRRYVDPKEAPRHYVDLDVYLPAIRDTGVLRYSNALAHFGADTLRRHGELPWAIHRMYLQLVEAFRQRQTARALKLAAELSHYIADAAVPLHTTSNYDGQRADLRGIHVLWESTLPERYGSGYSWYLAPATVLDAPLSTSWQLVRESYTQVDTLLGLAQRLRASRAADARVGFVVRGRSTVGATSQDYSSAYHELLGGMIERCLQRAAQRVASFWLSAWVEAGQPDVSLAGVIILDQPEEVLPQHSPACRD
jgi:hypothetical protein